MSQLAKLHPKSEKTLQSKQKHLVCMNKGMLFAQNLISE